MQKGANGRCFFILVQFLVTSKGWVLMPFWAQFLEDAVQALGNSIRLSVKRGCEHFRSDSELSLMVEGLKLLLTFQSFAFSGNARV